MNARAGLPQLTVTGALVDERRPVGLLILCHPNTEQDSFAIGREIETLADFRDRAPFITN